MGGGAVRLLAAHLVLGRGVCCMRDGDLLVERVLLLARLLLVAAAVSAVLVGKAGWRPAAAEPFFMSPIAPAAGR